MSKPFQRGLVVGKFCPLHRGHEFLITQAREQCEELVLISYTSRDFAGCEAERREQWLATLFPEAVRLVLGPGDAMPEDGADDRQHRQFVGRLCAERIGLPVDAVFTSETYGDGFAEELGRGFEKVYPGHPGVSHVCVDQARSVVPVSGTQVRRDLHANRHWLSPEVYASFVQRIVFLGGESSGKSVIAEAMAKILGTLWAPEYGRELWVQQSGHLAYDDFLRIAQIQIAREEEVAGKACQYLFCDTSPLTTLFYCLDQYGHAPPALEALACRKYDLYVLCEPDFPFVQDGTRRDDAFRQRQHFWYQERLNEARLVWTACGGSLEERIQTVMQAIGK